MSGVRLLRGKGSGSEYIPFLMWLDGDGVRAYQVWKALLLLAWRGLQTVIWRRQSSHAWFGHLTWESRISLPPINFSISRLPCVTALFCNPSGLLQGSLGWENLNSRAWLEQRGKEPESAPQYASPCFKLFAFMGLILGTLRSLSLQYLF